MLTAILIVWGSPTTCVAAASSCSSSRLRHVSRPLVSSSFLPATRFGAAALCRELLEKPAYSEYELLLVDNGSETAEAKLAAGMAQWQRASGVLTYPQQGNVAALRNFAVAQARGEYVLLLNPFAVITQGDWLDELLNHAQRPEVGIVGAKLFNPDGYVLHAGLVLGLQGPAGVPFYGQAMQSAGYMFRLQAVQDLSAVGADCLMVRKSVFDAVDGLDEQSLPRTLHEVDLALRVARQGYLVVWTPYAVLALGAHPSSRCIDEAAISHSEQEKNFLQALAAGGCP